MADAVLDASAVLAVLRREPGADTVAAIMPSAVISAVNLAEIISKLVERGASPETACELVDQLPFSVAPFDATLARRAGALRSATRSKGLSLGDRCCLALAEQQGAPALTTDRRWAELNIGISIQLIR